MSPTRSKEPKSSEVTPERVFLSRRELLKDAARFGLTTAAVGGGLVLLTGRRARAPRAPQGLEATPVAASVLEPKTRVNDAGDEALTPFADVTTYNNFYEFGLSKADPAERASTLRPRPWTVEVDGETLRPQRLDMEDLLRRFELEERIYRFRCVEAWSMVIPWVGFPLAALIRQLEPGSAARYVAFTTLHDPEQMPGQRRGVLDWPYVEALRMDEALHPLAFLAVGLYGKVLPNQNGAPLRLVVPWKYGFKSIKSIVRISFTRTQPRTTWSAAAPDEYGFFANVNPEVDHPRWSQATERRVGELRRRKTLPFNGYADQVADLYRGMDLRRSF